MCLFQNQRYIKATEIFKIYVIIMLIDSTLLFYQLIFLLVASSNFLRIFLSSVFESINKLFNCLFIEVSILAMNALDSCRPGKSCKRYLRTFCRKSRFFLGHFDQTSRSFYWIREKKSWRCRIEVIKKIFEIEGWRMEDSCFFSQTFNKVSLNL